MYIDGNFISAKTYFTSELTGMAKFIISDVTAFTNAVNKKLIPGDITALVNTEGVINGLDLIIDTVDWVYGDVHKIEQHVGNTFHIHFLGMDAIKVSITGQLVDLEGSYAKKNLMLLYEHVLRMTAIARTRVVPTLQCMGYFIDGGITTMEVTERSNMDDVVFVSMDFQVLGMTITAPDNKSGCISTIIEFV